MLADKTIAVVVPCYNEQTQVTRVLETMPDFVDCIIVVDDCSTDDTAKVVRDWIDSAGQDGQRAVFIKHETNGGVGKTICTGYKEAVRRGLDVAAVMAGDGQMQPEELHVVAGIVATGEADYAKANRLFFEGAWDTIPRHRYLGNAYLSLITKIASGYWHVADSQAGYTAISRELLELIDIDRIYSRYGYPNDMLVRLNVLEAKVADVSIKPIYNVGEQSKMKIWKVAPRMSWLIWKRFIWRMGHKYVIQNFHPLVLFYSAGAAALLAGLLLGVYLVGFRLFVGPAAGTSSILAAMLVLSGLQLLLFGMWFDMEVNRPLRVSIHRRWARAAEVLASATPWRPKGLASRSPAPSSAVEASKSAWASR